jgi:transposase
LPTADDDATLKATVTWHAYLPPDPLARWRVDVITPLELRAIYAHDSPRGGEAIAPAMRCGLLWSGEATGPVRSRQLARATAAARPCHCLAGGLPPEHATLANFRHTLRPERQDLCGPLL